MVKEIRHNFTEEQKQRIMQMHYCMREAYLETIYDYVKKGRQLLRRINLGDWFALFFLRKHWIEDEGISPLLFWPFKFDLL